MNILQIINKPTGTAVAYGLDKGHRRATFDVALLTVEEGIFEAKATTNGTSLGGEDSTTKDVSSDLRALRCLRPAWEHAKHIADFYTYTSITRVRFEDLRQDLFRSTLEPVENVLHNSRNHKADVHEIVLVGGSTRIEPNKSIIPDEAVAYGAATHLLLDVASSPSASRPPWCCNTIVPTKKSDALSNAPTTSLGERACTNANNLLGKFELSGIHPVPRGVPQLEVTVFASEKTNGKSSRTTITNDKGRLSKEEVVRMLRGTGFAAAARITAKNGLGLYAYNDEKLFDKFNAGDASKFDGAVNDTIKWLDASRRA
ncbi:hypothetical protein DFH06DRAFT_1401515 [Mycena polygramma]|nr:hypothetical protein DFH06DRAFT_1401515 [Mycena polygramma]